MKLIGSKKKLIDKIKNGENVPSFEVVEAVSVQCNLVDNNINKRLRYYIIIFPTNLALIFIM